MKVIHVLRKPCSEPTVAANVLRHGTGALNIDATRIGTTVETWPKSRSYPLRLADNGGEVTYGSKDAPTELTQDAPAGRWPANLILDGSDEVVALFPNCGGVVAMTQQASSGFSGYPATEMSRGGAGVKDSGSAARFFKQVGRKQVGG